MGHYHFLILTVIFVAYIYISASQADNMSESILKREEGHVREKGLLDS